MSLYDIKSNQVHHDIEPAFLEGQAKIYRLRNGQHVVRETHAPCKVLYSIKNT